MGLFRIIKKYPFVTAILFIIAIILILLSAYIILGFMIIFIIIILLIFYKKGEKKGIVEGEKKGIIEGEKKGIIEGRFIQGRAGFISDVNYYINLYPHDSVQLNNIKDQVPTEYTNDDDIQKINSLKDELQKYTDLKDDDWQEEFPGEEEEILQYVPSTESGGIIEGEKKKSFKEEFDIKRNNLINIINIKIEEFGHSTMLNNYLKDIPKSYTGKKDIDKLDNIDRKFKTYIQPSKVEYHTKKKIGTGEKKSYRTYTPKDLIKRNKDLRVKINNTIGWVDNIAEVELKNLLKTKEAKNMNEMEDYENRYRIIYKNYNDRVSN